MSVTEHHVSETDRHSIKNIPPVFSNQPRAESRNLKDFQFYSD